MRSFDRAAVEMQGQGTFYDVRLDDAAKFPVAARNRFGHKTPPVDPKTGKPGPDLVTPKLAALHFYQLALKAPKPPAGSFDANAAKLGQQLFADTAKCASCHVPPLFTEPGWNTHTAAEIHARFGSMEPAALEADTTVVSLAGRVLGDAEGAFEKPIVLAHGARTIAQMLAIRADQRKVRASTAVTRALRTNTNR